MSRQKFDEYTGQMYGLPTDGKHLVYRWNSENTVILFSITRKGNAASCHFASDKNGLRFVKEAINDFCDFCFIEFDWCRMIIAQVDKGSVKRLITKCGFVVFAEDDNSSKSAWMRCRNGIH